MAFAGLYVFYSVLMLIVSRHLTGFRWSPVNVGLLGWMIPLVTVVFVAMITLPAAWSVSVGLAATLAAGWVCLKGLFRRVPGHRLARLEWLARLCR